MAGAARNNQPPTDALQKLGGAALARDEKLRAQTRDVFSGALARAKYILDHGSESDRNSLIKSIVPNLLRSLQDEQADLAKQAQKAAYDRMRAAMRGEGDGAPGTPAASKVKPRRAAK